MKTSWQIARIAGIAVQVHVTFPLLLIWTAAMTFQQAGTWGDFAANLALVLLLFAIVVLHELGHALMARHFGIRTHDITLFPIGGVARLERMPEKPREELAVALAGPAVNVALAALLFAALFAAGVRQSWGEMAVGGDRFVARLAWLNVGMALFNLLPAFPMDGGRVLRAALALRTSYVRATTIAASVGKILAVALGVVGIFANPFLVLIALFVWTAADAEERTIRIESSLARVPAASICVHHFQTLTPELTLAEAIEPVASSYQRTFPVMQNGQLAGLLTRTRLRESLGAGDAHARVGDVMERAVLSIDAGEKIGEVLGKLREKPGPLPVLRDGELIGLLDLDSLAEYLSFHPPQVPAPGGRGRRVQVPPQLTHGVPP